MLDFPYTSMKSLNTFKITSEQLVSIILSPNQKDFLVLDAKENSLKTIDKIGKVLNTTNLNNLLKTPISLCSKSNKAETEFFIASYENEEVLVFDTSFNLKKKLCKNIVKKPCCITIDDELLYIGDWDENVLTVLNIKKNEKVKSFDIDSPVAIKTTIDKIYVLSRTEAKFNDLTKRLEKIEKGANCIFVYDKIKYNLVGKINVSNWISPAGLHIDKKTNYIYTIAYELDKNHLRSSSRYLFVLNNKSDVVKKIYLDGVQFISDMIVNEHRLIFCINDSIKVVELE